MIRAQSAAVRRQAGIEEPAACDEEPSGCTAEGEPPDSSQEGAEDVPRIVDGEIHPAESDGDNEHLGKRPRRAADDGWSPRIRPDQEGQQEIADRRFHGVGPLGRL